MSEHGITRRALLAAAGVAAVGGIVATRGWRALVEVVPASNAERLARVFAHEASARRLGERVLEDLGTRPPATSLVADVERVIDGGARTVARASDAELRTLVGAAIRRDFADGRVAEVDGWVLSATETRLYALAALAPAAG